MWVVCLNEIYVFYAPWNRNLRNTLNSNHFSAAGNFRLVYKNIYQWKATNAEKNTETAHHTLNSPQIPRNDP